MLALDWRLALVTFSVLPLFFLVTDWFRRGARESFRETRKWVARIGAFLQENLSGMSVVQLFRREARNAAGVRRDQPRPRRREHARALLLRGLLPRHRVPGRPGHRPHPASTAAGRCSWAALTLGALVAFIQYSERFWRPISDLSEKFNILQAAMASSERIFLLLDTKAEIVAPRAPVRGRTVIQGGWRSRTSGSPTAAKERADWVLRDISFAVAPGEERRPRGRHRGGQDLDHQPPAAASTTCSRGASPSTGSTCATSTRSACAPSLALVLQDVHLFSGTIASNIRLGSDIPDDRRAGRGAGGGRRTASSRPCPGATTRR